MYLENVGYAINLNIDEVERIRKCGLKMGRKRKMGPRSCIKYKNALGRIWFAKEERKMRLWPYARSVHLFMRELIFWAIKRKGTEQKSGTHRPHAPESKNILPGKK